MLQFLKIRNLALLEEVALEFEAGFTAVTGETGAGKSILLGGAEPAGRGAGGKDHHPPGRGRLRGGGRALFPGSGEAIDAVLAELGLPACEEGMLVLKRSLPRDKPPRITVNGSLATLAALQRLGEHWIDFHGPERAAPAPPGGLPARAARPVRPGRRRAGRLPGGYRAWRGRLAERERAAERRRGCRPTRSSFSASGWRRWRPWTLERRGDRGPGARFPAAQPRAGADRTGRAPGRRGSPARTGLQAPAGRAPARGAAAWRSSIRRAGPSPTGWRGRGGAERTGRGIRRPGPGAAVRSGSRPSCWPRG